MEWEVRYLKYEGLQVAYASGGETGPQVLSVPNWITNLEVSASLFAIPSVGRRLASSCRLATFDFPGTGSSDPIPLDAVRGLDFWVELVRVVMDEIGWERPNLFANDAGGLVALTFTARYPDRVESIVLGNPAAAYAPDVAAEVRDQIADAFAEMYGRPEYVRMVAPSTGDQPGRDREQAKWLRQATRPAVMRPIVRMILDIDVRDRLQDVRCPVLLIHSATNFISDRERVRYLRDSLPSTTYVELPGNDMTPVRPEDTERWLAEIRRFLLGEADAVQLDRVLSTVLFTDIVASTSRTSEIGDHRWREVLDNHDELVRGVLRRFGGRLIKSTGDGILATIDGPARAVRCAQELRDVMRDLDLEIRAGLHTGEIELRGDDVGGIAVTIARRVCDSAGPNEVLASATVVGVVAGSGLRFEEIAEVELKGVPGTWRLSRALD